MSKQGTKAERAAEITRRSVERSGIPDTPDFLELMERGVRGRRPKEQLLLFDKENNHELPSQRSNQTSCYGRRAHS